MRQPGLLERIGNWCSRAINWVGDTIDAGGPKGWAMRAAVVVLLLAFLPLWAYVGVVMGLPLIALSIAVALIAAAVGWVKRSVSKGRAVAQVLITVVCLWGAYRLIIAIMVQAREGVWWAEAFGPWLILGICAGLFALLGAAFGRERPQ